MLDEACVMAFAVGEQPGQGSFDPLHCVAQQLMDGYKYEVVVMMMMMMVVEDSVIRGFLNAWRLNRPGNGFGKSQLLEHEAIGDKES
jgi:hypothetical protein